MKKLTSFLLVLSFTSLVAFGQQLKIPMQPDSWEFDENQVEFINYKGVKASRGVDGQWHQIFLKDIIFEDGTIEFDVEFLGDGFPGINFRMSGDRKNGENFYIRSFKPFKDNKRTTLQYASIIDGMSTWDITDDYQASADINQNEWNHVKLVVSGKQMKVYINDQVNPAMHVPYLESERQSGGISLNGNVIFSNVVIKPNETENVSPDPIQDITQSDPRYIRNWHVSEPVDFPFGKDIIIDLPTMYGDPVDIDLPDSTTRWSKISSTQRSLVNLSDKFGLTEREVERRLVWLKTNIHSDSTQIRKLSLGFSDEIWVFINRQILHIDKNYFGTPSAKEPGGRCSIENLTISLPLEKGDNELLIGVANYFYGWGMIARLDSTDDLTLE